MASIIIGIFVLIFAVVFLGTIWAAIPFLLKAVLIVVAVLVVISLIKKA